MTNTFKKKAAYWIVRMMSAASATAAGQLIASAAGGDNNPNAELDKVTKPIIGLVNQVFNILIPLVGAIGAIYCISLGIKFSRAEEPQEREKAKQHLKNAIIGFVIIFVLVVALRIAVPQLTHWMDAAASNPS